eukprot:SAG31_NODE_34685_length_330_cov_1.108225_1_plen_86_part_10
MACFVLLTAARPLWWRQDASAVRIVEIEGLVSAVKALKLEELRLWQVNVQMWFRIAETSSTQFHWRELSSHHFGSATHLAIDQRAL